MMWLAWLFASPSSYADHKQDREAIGRVAVASFMSGDTATLDRMEKQFRTTHERTSAGLWKLQLLYLSLAKLYRFTDPNDPNWVSSEAMVDAWRERHHTDSPLAIIMSAKIHFRHGYAYRGDGAYSDLPPQYLAPMQSQFELVRQILDDNAEVGRLDPEWYAIRIHVANMLGEKKSDILALAEKGLESAPSYYTINAAAFHALLPAWGGSPTLIRQSLTIAAKHSAQGESLQFYGRAFADMAGEISPTEMVRDGFRWETAQASFEEINKAYPDPWNLNVYAVVACIAGRRDELRSIFQRLAGAINPDAWLGHPEWVGKCQQFAA